MQDRPTSDELLAAVERFLTEDVVPNMQGSRAFHARVAANVIGIVRRESELEEAQLLSEWTRLGALLGEADLPADRASLREAVRVRSGELCERIRAGGADSGPFAEAVWSHVRATVHDKLLVSNPAWLDASAG